MIVNQNCISKIFNDEKKPLKINPRNSGEELTIKTMTYALHYQNGEQKQWYTVEVALLSLGTFARFKLQ